MKFQKTSMGWCDASGEYWDDDDFLALLENLDEGSILRIFAELEDDEDEDSDEG
jgi:hypothetical protein